MTDSAPPRQCSDRIICGRRCGLDAPGPWVLTPMYCPYVARPVAMVDVLPTITPAECYAKEPELRRDELAERAATLDERADYNQ